MTPDGTPVVGATRYDNLFLNTGHGTLGWTMACGSGKLVADRSWASVRPSAPTTWACRATGAPRAAAAGAGRQGRLSPTDVCLQRRPEAGAFIPRPAHDTGRAVVYPASPMTPCRDMAVNQAGRCAAAVGDGRVPVEGRPRRAHNRRMTHILHTADWQIGRQYGQFDSDDAAMLAEARDAVAGSPNWRPSAAWTRCWWPATQISDRGIRRLFGALGAYAGPWVMIAGNHDAALADSVWTRAIQLGCVPANVHVPLRAGVVDLPGANLAVLAAPLTQRHTYDDVTQAFDLMESEAGRVRVGLAHGSVTGRLPDTIDATNPIAADRAARARLDYLALGDWHGCLRVDERCWYAGTPEQDRFRGNEPGYVLDVRIAGPARRRRSSAWPGPLPLVGLARDAELADRCPGAGRPSGRAARTC